MTSSRPVGPAFASCAVHLAVLGIALWMASPEPRRVSPEAGPRPSALGLVWFDPAGLGGGGGGGGQRQLRPARRAEGVGADKAHVRVRPPAPIEPAQRVSPAPVEPPVLAAIEIGASSELHAGVSDDRAQTRVESRGTGFDDGVGAGKRGGAGDDIGAGLGPGREKGVGDRPYLVGNGVSSPRLIYSRQPVYTTSAMHARVSGRVLLECIVERDGRVGRVRVLRSLDAVHGLDDEAINAVRAWRFAPGTLRGEPVPVLITIETSYTIH